MNSSSWPTCPRCGKTVRPETLYRSGGSPAHYLCAVLEGQDTARRAAILRRPSRLARPSGPPSGRARTPRTVARGGAAGSSLNWSGDAYRSKGKDGAIKDD